MLLYRCFNLVLVYFLSCQIIFCLVVLILGVQSPNSDLKPDMPVSQIVWLQTECVPLCNFVFLVNLQHASIPLFHMCLKIIMFDNCFVLADEKKLL